MNLSCIKHIRPIQLSIDATMDDFVAKEMQQDQVDLLHDSLATLPTGNFDPVVPNTRTPQRSRRSATAIAAAFMGIA